MIVRSKSTAFAFAFAVSVIGAATACDSSSDDDSGNPSAGAAGSPAAGSMAMGGMPSAGSANGGQTSGGQAGASTGGSGGSTAGTSGTAGSGGLAAGGGGLGGAGGTSGSAGASGASTGGSGGSAGSGGGKGGAVANIAATSGSQLTGTATFTPAGQAVTLTIQVSNCPVGNHATHLHLNKNCGNNGDDAGGHWVPQGEGIPDINCMANGMGTVTFTPMDGRWTIGSGANDVTTHAIVVHQGDNANPGGRIGCGLINTQ